jgi:hypothetical protein
MLLALSSLDVEGPSALVMVPTSSCVSSRPAANYASVHSGHRRFPCCQSVPLGPGRVPRMQIGLPERDRRHQVTLPVAADAIKVRPTASKIMVIAVPNTVRAVLNAECARGGHRWPCLAGKRGVRETGDPRDRGSGLRSYHMNVLPLVPGRHPMAGRCQAFRRDHVIAVLPRRHTMPSATCCSSIEQQGRSRQARETSQWAGIPWR